MGFYRHDQWGLLAFLDDTRGLPIFFFVGGDHRLEGTVTGSNHQQGGATSEVNAQAHAIVVP